MVEAETRQIEDGVFINRVIENDGFHKSDFKGESGCDARLNFAHSQIAKSPATAA